MKTIYSISTVYILFFSFLVFNSLQSGPGDTERQQLQASDTPRVSQFKISAQEYLHALIPPSCEDKRLVKLRDLHLILFKWMERVFYNHLQGDKSVELFIE